MTVLSALALFGVMITLAALPSASVALVVSRSATFGFRNGVAVAIGIVLGDLVFATLAILGMSFLAETMGGVFMILRYFGAAYLMWLGISLIRSRPTPPPEKSIPPRATLMVSGLSGLLLTLGDVKAILFYASLFPTFVDMTAITVRDATTIALITFFAVGGVKVAYALVAEKLVVRLQNHRLQRGGRVVAGGLLTSAGAWLFAKS